MTIRPILILFLTSLLVGTGCSIVHTVPLAGREGDTILVSTGSPDNMTEANITSITYTPTSTGTPITIPNTQIHSVFNLYPDKKAAAWLYSDAVLIENKSGHGPWTTIIALDLPTGGSALPVGIGALQVNTTATYGDTVPGINGADMALEILPATATSPDPSPFTYRGTGGIELSGDLTQLSPMPRLEFRPTYTGVDGANTYGAVEVKIDIDRSGLGETDYNIILDDKIGTIQTRNVTFTSHHTRFETTVYMISPTGELQYSDVNFSIISQGLVNPVNAYVLPTDTDITTTWYDIDGNVVIPPVDRDVKVANLTGLP